MYPKEYLKIINEICNKHSIHIKQFPGTSILKLSNKQIQHYIWSRRFDLNTSLSARIADHKYETFVVLSSSGIPVVECYKLNRPDMEEHNLSKKNNTDICKMLLETQHAIVIKPNNCYEGTDVFKCENMKEVEEVFHLIGYKYKFLVASPFINSVAEYRCFYLNSEILLIYKKKLPYVTSDGHSTLIELLTKEKYDLRKLPSSLIPKLYDVYEQDTKIYLNWKYNLSQGSFCSIIPHSTLYDNLTHIACQAAEAIGISFATIDLLEDTQGVLKVLEINAGVAMDQFIKQMPDGREIATSIYEKAILSMFNR